MKCECGHLDECHFGLFCWVSDCPCVHFKASDDADQNADAIDFFAEMGIEIS